MKAPGICHPPPPPPIIPPPPPYAIKLTVDCYWYWKVGPEEETFDDTWDLRLTGQPINVWGFSHSFQVSLRVYLRIIQRAYHGQVKTEGILYRGAAMKSQFVDEFRWTLRDDPFRYYYSFKSIWTPERITLSITEKPR